MKTLQLTPGSVVAPIEQDQADKPSWSSAEPYEETQHSDRLKAAASAISEVAEKRTSKTSSSTRRESTTKRQNELRWKKYRSLCDELNSEVARAQAACGENGVLHDQDFAITAELDGILERLFDCEWGEGDSLKRIVVAAQAQVNNRELDRRHVGYLHDLAHLLRIAYVVDRATVKSVLELARVHGLEEFRGTLSS